MKQINKYIIYVIGVILSLSSCEKHDALDDIAFIGKQGPNVYWEVPILSVLAGDSVGFTAQYWSVDKTITYVGVWYEINNDYTYTAKDVRFNYELSITEQIRARELQEIINLTDRHNESLWHDSLRAYVLEAKFPVSHTLTSTRVSNPTDKDLAISTIENNFPSNFEEDFREGIFESMLNLKDSLTVLRMFTVDFPRTDTLTVYSFFEEYETDEDEVSTITGEAAKSKLKEMLNSVPLDSLIYDSNGQSYSMDYVRAFTLKARFKAVNGEGGENLTDPQRAEITVE